MNKKKLPFALLIIVFILFSLYIVNLNKKEDTYSNTYYNLGTINEITLYNINKKIGDEILKECGSILTDIENKMSSQLTSSEISKINNMAGKDYVKVSEDTFYVIKESIEFSKISNDTFDISIGPIIDLWSIGTDSAKVPSKEEISDKLSLVDYKNILLDENTHSVKLNKENMKIDLGGIAKGYAADKIYKYLKEENLESALINLGGNVYALGTKKNNEPFSIGIQDPTKPRGNSIGNIKVSNKSVVTSGIYERYIEKNNKIYHHMINPHTGYPFENNLSSVTIISNNSMICDALSTTTFGLGLEKGMQLVENLDNVEAIFITKDKKIYLSSNLKNKFNLTDNSFSICDLNN
ncbi:FAD:protein FMN transferase [Terrisporobacter sp.]|uniref:FAD:protein FMN transferase n=1 Tax=Terrisporobacter sp. TaxID=1965305 RepID=UPI002610991C|nr:FAD:protein FMN transferase [Terrisporobacter sp.]